MIVNSKGINGSISISHVLSSGLLVFWSSEGLRRVRGAGLPCIMNFVLYYYVLFCIVSL